MYPSEADFRVSLVGFKFVAELPQNHRQIKVTQLKGTAITAAVNARLVTLVVFDWIKYRKAPAGAVVDCW